MPVKIHIVEPRSLAHELGWMPGDEIVTINDRTISDVIDFRFFSADEVLRIRLRRQGTLVDQTIEKEADEPLGIELEEFRIKTCGDDCIFCFVDQNPQGLRDALYFRDGDFRMSFLYGNYITMTNLRQRDLDRIVEQRLSPLYVSVHCTDSEIRRRMMGHKTQNDQLMEKLEFLRANRIEMHTQIVLVPGFNDGTALKRTIEDLYAMRDAVQTVSIVPVGLTGHREGLTRLRGLTAQEAFTLTETVEVWQRDFRSECGRGFVYASDEVYLLAGRDFPDEEAYDGYPLMENGVGMSRDFLNELAFQGEEFPDALPEARTLTLVTSSLPAPLIESVVAPRLRSIAGLDVRVVVADNLLFGEAVTVSGLLNYRSIAAALRGRNNGHLILLPPDVVNFEGAFLDNVPGANTPEDLAQEIGVPVRVFGGDWLEVIEFLEQAGE